MGPDEQLDPLRRGLRRAQLIVLIGVTAACGQDAPGPAGGGSGPERPHVAASPGVLPTSTARPPRGADYVDSAGCAECHRSEWDQWVGSHHDLAMQEATEQTVLGDFDDAVFEHLGATTRFFRRDGAFYVNAEGPDGELTDYRVSYTFGVEPLQQYLIEFDNGALQCLTVAWDSDAGRWFDLYPDERLEAGDQLHWTGRYQRWNAMCAECHSTRLEKNYDVATDSYATTWHELDVGCQACHGPGGDHVEWARKNAGDARKGALGWREVGLTTGLRRAEAEAQLDACAPCHSRRSQLNPDYVHGQPFLESFAPELLRAGLYHADGQILDEVYVYGSFVQSKMHAAGVACTDCHNPHSLEPLETGDALCMQCHTEFAPTDRFPTLQAKSYNTREHHGHPPESEGARCVSCHMPERTYMVIDERRDHSFRIPRPDLSAAVGTPNACNDCHGDQTPGWAVEQLAGWREAAGAEVDAGPHYGYAIARARMGDPESFVPLVELALDAEAPPIVRATALDLLRGFGPDAVQAAQALLTEEDVLVRTAAVRGLDVLSGAQKLQAISVAEDESLAVQVEAGRVLAEVLEVMAGGGGLMMAGPVEEFRELWGAAVKAAYARYEAAQALSADLPSAHLNLGVLYEDLGRSEDAEREYELALEQDPAFLLARFNLATLLNKLGRNRSALAVLSKGLEFSPDEGELHYSLGLLQAEMGDQQASAESLLRAAARLPGRRGVHRNAGLALLAVGRTVEAEQILMDGARLYPEDPGLQHALAYLFAASGDRARSLTHARRLRELDPESPPPEELVERMLEDLGQGR